MAEELGGQPFHRPQRFQIPQIEGELEIPAPPQPHEDTARNLLLTILPLLGVLILPLFYLIAGGTNRGTSFVVPMLMMGGLSGVSALLMYAEQNKQKRHREIKQRAKFRRLLERRVARLQAGIDLQRHIENHNFPSPDQLNALIAEGNAEFWNRRLTDEDFGTVRVGIGDIPSRVKVNRPDPDQEAVDIRLALDTAFDYKVVPAAPITLNLLRTGSVGVVGSTEHALCCAYSLLAQLVVFSAPDDLSLYLFSSRPNYQRWSWMRWLPHTSSSQTGGFPNHLAYDDEQVRALLSKLANIAQERLGQEKPSFDHYIVVVIDTLTTLRTEPVFATLLQTPGISVLCLAEQIADVPTECKASIGVKNSGEFDVKFTGKDGGKLEGRAEFLQRTQVELIGRKLVGYHVPRKSGSARIPNTVTFLQLTGAETIAQLNIQHRWQSWRQRMKYDMLPFGVPIGSLSFSDLMMMDLSEDKHGPHGLIAGTTGAGKSELLQTLVMALAVDHPVDALNFLLIDFKGGSTFDVFKDLPHVVGLVTNLSDPGSGRTAKIEALRAMEAIRAENERRQMILKRVRVRDIHDYQSQFRLGWEPLPHLLILIDEFAELANDLPNFIPELVSTVRVGRSLGMHLLLAMQRPFGYVTAEMSANLQLRICLRVQNAQDSTEMIGTPEASALPTEPRGRAFFKAGSASPLLFQVARIGVDYSEDVEQIQRQRRKANQVEVLRREQRVEPKAPGDATKTAENTEKTDEQKLPTLAQALVAYMGELHQRLNEAAPNKVLPDPTPPRISLDDLLATHDHVVWRDHQWRQRSRPLERIDVPFGLIDDLQNQTTRLLSFTIGDGGGHRLVVGMTGAGKTTLVRTLLWSIARTMRPDEVMIYILNFGGRGFDQFEQLPHVGAVIGGSEMERITRLLGWLQDQMRVRTQVFSQVKASGLAHYNQLAAQNLNALRPLTPIILFLHNFVEFKNMFFREIDQKGIEEFTRLVREGQSYGLQLIITATQPNDVPYSVRTLIDSRIALKLSEKSDYVELVGSLGEREINPRPGSGVISGPPPLHLQIAMPTTIEGADAYSDYEQATIEAMRTAAAVQGITAAATPIGTLPLSITLDGAAQALDQAVSRQGLRHSLPRRAAHRRAPYEPLTSVIGMDGVTLNHVHLQWLNAGQHFLITGSTQSGKTTLLKTLLLGAADRFAPNELRIFLINFGSSTVQRLSALPHVTYISTPETLTSLTQQLSGEFYWRRSQRSADQGYTEDDSSDLQFPALIVAIDDYDQLRDAPTAEPSLGLIGQMIRRRPELNIHVVIAADINVGGQRPDNVIRAIRQNGSGFTLITVDGVELLGAPVTAAMRREQLVEGRGYRITARRAHVMQFAQVQSDARLIRDIQSRWQGVDPYALHEGTAPVSVLPLPTLTPVATFEDDDDFGLFDDVDRTELLREYQLSRGHNRIVSIEDIEQAEKPSAPANRIDTDGSST